MNIGKGSNISELRAQETFNPAPAAKPPGTAPLTTSEKNSSKNPLRDSLGELGDSIIPDMQKNASTEDRSSRWAALLTGKPSLKEIPADLARSQFLEWLTSSAEGVFSNLQDLPGVFQTTRFWNEVKNIESPARFLKTISENLNSGSLSFFEAVDCIGRSFAWDEERLSRWKQERENLAGLKRWLPVFTHAHEYLMAAFPLSIEKLDQLRTMLLQSIEEPHHLIDPGIRTEFYNRFLEFKKNYTDSYFLLHEEALHVVSGMKKDEIKVDPIALRNLELFSTLPHADQSYLNRVKLLARWIQRNQCNLPVDQILELYPRCYCNFNPANEQHPAGSAAKVNSLIQEGLEYFRSVLRRCGHWIKLECKAQSVEEASLDQIAAILGDAPLMPVKPATIKILNQIITRNSGQFRKAASGS